MPVLVRTRSVMRRKKTRQFGHGQGCYVAGEPGDTDVHHIDLAYDVFEGLGKPDFITITIEAGDLLNEASDG